MNKTKKSKPANSNKLDPKLLKILACPVALKTNPNKPGTLKLYKNSWLISNVSGCKYPIVDGIPILLIDVGKKYQNTKNTDLPVPPPDFT